jgi:hypothetical protein
LADDETFELLHIGAALVRHDRVGVDVNRQILRPSRTE